MIESLQDFTAPLPIWLQWLAVMAIGAIPLNESSFGSVNGVVAGLPTSLAIGSFKVRNIVGLLPLVLGARAYCRSGTGPLPQAAAPFANISSSC
ncbi:hypothetical protein [Arthrobacter castelli]|uniref:hypothetical protein n=1 Tax=Arthrobacter castelli TaxID=271431 RepID=UPI0012DDAA36|nr:hypothetical protein [Arthrobacter castelli]